MKGKLKTKGAKRVQPKPERVYFLAKRQKSMRKGRFDRSPRTNAKRTERNWLRKRPDILC